MTRPAPALGPALVLYTAGRLGLVVLVAGVLVVAGVPLLLALLIGVIAALPLATVALRGPRARLDAALASTGARRSAARDELRARLRGGDELAPDAEDAATPGAAESGAADDPRSPSTPAEGSDAAGQPQPDGRERGPGE